MVSLAAVSALTAPREVVGREGSSRMQFIHLEPISAVRSPGRCTKQKRPHSQICFGPLSENGYRARTIE